MFKRTVFLFMSAALALPAIAAAKTIDVDGPLTLRGHGPLRAQLASAEGSARVSIKLGGKIVVTGLARDLEVSCTGPRVKVRTATNRRGLKKVACMGQRMNVVISAAGRFHFGALARLYVLEIPDGVSGKLHGNFRGRPQQPPAEEAPAEEQPADERPAA